VLHMQLCSLTDVPAIAAALGETVQVDALPRSVLSTRREPACNHNIRVAMVVSCAIQAQGLSPPGRAKDGKKAGTDP
jgi:hypothetical protein